MSFRKSYLILISFLFFEIVSASNYTPLDTANIEQRKTIAKSYLKKQKDFMKSLSADFRGGELGYVKHLMKESKDEFHKEILNGDYIFNDTIFQLINQTADRLRVGNSQIDKSLDFYVSRNISLNATSLADKSLIMNLGSFFFLENELQLSVLLSHEFAHLILKHEFTSLKKEYQDVTEESRKSVAEIKKSRYGRGTKALEKYKQMIYANGKMSRYYEYQADSLGYVMYRNAGLASSEYLNAFRLMLEYDTVRTSDLDMSVYKKVFDLPEQKFKDEWLEMEDFKGYDYTKYKEKFNSDSIKSHPEMNERIAKLKATFSDLPDTVITPVLPGPLFSKVHTLTKYERFSSLDLDEDYGLGVFLCLANLANDTTDKDFYELWLGKYFTKILKARKEYNLNRYVDRVDPKNQPLAYQQFLNFMWNLKVEELEIIASHYTKKDS